MSYKVVRYFFDRNKEAKVIKTDLTLEEAQEHCQDESTEGPGWFDGYTEE